MEKNHDTKSLIETEQITQLDFCLDTQTRTQTLPVCWISNLKGLTDSLKSHWWDTWIISRQIDTKIPTIPANIITAVPGDCLQNITYLTASKSFFMGLLHARKSCVRKVFNVCFLSSPKSLFCLHERPKGWVTPSYINNWDTQEIF